MLIHERIAGLRDERKWSRALVARKAGLPEKTLERIELGRNKPRVDTLNQIASAYGMTLAELLRGVVVEVPA